MGANMSPIGKGRGYRRRQFTEINITPFVDVMLVLLIIFMVTAPMMTTGVAVDLPDSNAKAVPGTDEPISISVTSSGKIFIQDTKVTLNDLQPKLEAIVGENRETRIFVRGDTSIDYGLVMRVIGEINGAGYNKVALITEGTGAKR
ncbi:MAG: protein TolR [Rickettsiales bacterium]|nr:protein TolR [Rickettsiales bacterium]